MYRFLFFLLIFSSLLACSGPGPGSEDDPVLVKQDVAPTDPGTNTPVPEPDLRYCLDQPDANAGLLTSGFGFNHANTRNQASAINSGNVASLVRSYEYASEGLSEKRGAPAVTEQVVYFTSGDELIAMNRKTGCLYWVYQLFDSAEGFYSASVLLVNTIPEQGPVVFAADYNGYVYAVDAQSGALLWRRFVGIAGDSKSISNHFVSGGMQYYDGQLFVPVSSKEEVANTSDIYNPCCSTHGLLVAFDAVSGGKNWVFHTTEDATLFVDTQRSGPNGVAIWSTPTIDAARNAIYIGTGQNYTEPVTVHSDAIVSVNMDNGLANWVFQARDNDAWNAACEYPDEQIEVAPGQLWNLYERCPQAQGQAFGFTAAPILADNGRVLIAGDKGGNVYSIDPDSGDINWQRKISTGGRNGGIHWGMAVDVNTVYVAATDLSANLANTDSPDAVALVEHAKPGIYALDLFDGGLIWETHRSHMYQGVATPSLYSASLSVTNDVLFAGSLDGVVTAFSTLTGAELWSFDTAIPVTDVHGVAGNGGTIDSVGAVIAGDSVLINSGFNSFGGASPYQAGPGNTLFLLTLPQ